MRRFLVLATALTAMSVLAACQDEPGEAEPDPAVAADLLDHVQTAIDALKAGGGNAETFTVLRAEHVLWPNGAVGCPQPDMMYTQAVVEGYRIVISTPDGDVYFHGQTGLPPARCDTPQEPIG